MRILLIFFLIAINFVNSFSQENGEAISLNLEKSIELALKNNHELRKSELDKRRAESQVREAWGSAVFPKINGSANYTRALKLPIFTFQIDTGGGTATQSFRMGSDNSITATVSAEQTILSGGLFLAVRVARIYDEIAEKALTGTRLNVITQVKKSFYSVLVAQEAVKLSKLNLKLAEDNFKNAQSMFDAGLTSEYDLIRARVQVQNFMPVLRQTENSYISAQNLLKILTGIELERKIQIEDSLDFNELDIPEFEESAAKLEQQNNLLNQLKLQVEFQDKNVTYQFTQHLPSLAAFGQWQIQAQENDGTKSFFKYPYRNAVSVGLNLRVPIFDGFQTTARVQQAKIDLLKANEDFILARKNLKSRLESLILDIKRNREQIDSYKATIAQAERGYEIAVKRFTTGLGTQLEVVDAQVALSQSKVNYLQTLFDYYISNAELDELLGEFNTEEK